MDPAFNQDMDAKPVQKSEISVDSISVEMGSPNFQGKFLAPLPIQENQEKEQILENGDEGSDSSDSSYSDSQAELGQLNNGSNLKNDCTIQPPPSLENSLKQLKFDSFKIKKSISVEKNPLKSDSVKKYDSSREKSSSSSGSAVFDSPSSKNQFSIKKENLLEKKDNIKLYESSAENQANIFKFGMSKIATNPNSDFKIISNSPKELSGEKNSKNQFSRFDTEPAKKRSPKIEIPEELPQEINVSKKKESSDKLKIPETLLEDVKVYIDEGKDEIASNIQEKQPILPKENEKAYYPGPISHIENPKKHLVPGEDLDESSNKGEKKDVLSSSKAFHARFQRNREDDKLFLSQKGIAKKPIIDVKEQVSSREQAKDIYDFKTFGPDLAPSPENIGSGSNSGGSHTGVHTPVYGIMNSNIFGGNLSSNRENLQPNVFIGQEMVDSFSEQSSYKSLQSNGGSKKNFQRSFEIDTNRNSIENELGIDLMSSRHNELIDLLNRSRSLSNCEKITVFMQALQDFQQQPLPQIQNQPQKKPGILNKICQCCFSSKDDKSCDDQPCPCDYLIKWSKINVDLNVEFHRKMLQKIYKNITGIDEWPKNNGLWNEIGIKDINSDFSGNISVVGFLFILFLQSYYNNHFMDWLFQTKNIDPNFPFLKMLAELALLAIDVLKAGKLEIYINPKKNPHEPVFLVYSGIAINYFKDIFTKWSENEGEISTISLKSSRLNPQEMIKIARQSSQKNQR
ncbi:unnamed protein product [Blepharisma stoltei]|uniref:ELMO domain-containing protein n=1 Tax=Blepharisma stoltei TaxID=1481888 RepID=A0AAU9JCJ2_9CILI|nr:unnamed protein product [Blepharisma stoltei]